MIETFSLDASLPDTPQVLAVGTFDGIHRGHQAILNSAVSEAQNSSSEPAVLTFRPDPVMILKNVLPTERKLLTREDKIAILDELGISRMYEIDFDLDFASLSPQTFINSVLLDQLQAESVHVGFNFRFGHERKGDTELLQEILSDKGSQLTVQKPVEIDGYTVSSTKIRQFIKDGEVEKARKLLGRPYVVKETIQEGQKRGREIGFPTFNFPVESTLHPRPGVYGVWLESERLFPAVANFGRHPTMGEASQPLLEVHTLGSPPDISAGDEARVHFGAFLRDEKNFETVEELKEQISKDVEQAKNIHDKLEEPNFTIENFNNTSEPITGEV